MMNKRMEVDISLGYEVALMIRFLHEKGLWEQYQTFKAQEEPWAKQEVENLFKAKGWTK